MCAMNVIVPLKPFCPGSENAESFHSLLLRTATAHGVKIGKLLDLIGAIRSSEVQCAPRGKGIAASLLGTGKVVQQMVAAYEALGGSPSAIRHTFYELFPVLSHRAIGLLEKRQRWCPACLDPDRGTGYGLLAHSLCGVANCRIHGCRLESHCLSCGQGTYHATNFIAEPKCTSCGAMLWNIKRDPVPQDRYAAWIEAQMYSIVEYVSDIDKPQIEVSWMSQAGWVLKQLIAEAKGKTDAFGRSHIWMLRNLGPQGLRISTILWLAASHSTSAVDVMLRPREVLTGVFPNLPAIPRRVSHRCRGRANHWPKTRSLLLSLMEACNACYLPSIATLSALTGVNESYVWCKDGDLFRYYNSKRKMQKHKHKVACDREYVVKTISLLPALNSNLYALREVLSRREAGLPDVTLKEIEAAVELTLGVVGRQIRIPPCELGDMFGAKYTRFE